MNTIAAIDIYEEDLEEFPTKEKNVVAEGRLLALKEKVV